MSTLTEILKTSCTRSLEDFEREKAAADARLIADCERRDALTPLERAGLPPIRKYSEPPPCVEIDGTRYPRLDKAFVQGTVKKMGGVLVPAFAIYSLGDPKGECVLLVTPDGAATSDWHAFPAGSFKGLVRQQYMRLNPWGWISRVAMPAAATVNAVAFVVCLAVSAPPALTGTLAGAFVLAGLWYLLSFLAGEEADPPRILATHRFSGVLPDEVRARVASVCKALGPQLTGRRRRTLWGNDEPEMTRGREYAMLLVEEAYNWECVREPRNLDPLLILSMDGGWYLIDKFDVTPAEAWAASEGQA